MTRFRRHWLALLGGALLLALSVSSAFGAKPAGDDPNHGQQVSTFVHTLVFGNDEPEEQPDEEEVDEEEDVTETDEEVVEEEQPVEDGDAGAHGACVSAFAQQHELVGGDNNNHGGFMSIAARFTCWGLEPPAEEPTADETTDEELTAADADATEAAAKDRGWSAAAHEKAKEHRGRGHGKGGRH